MVVVDENFIGVGQKQGIEVFRIKQFNVEPVPKSQYGNFFSGDSYIVLHTKPRQEWDIHYWLGKNTTQDEYGTAAYKAVELDQLLGGFPVQYREVEGYETSLFQSYFKGGIKYLKGGYASGFHHIDFFEEETETRLFQCKGKKYVRCWQVDVDYDSLNKGDVFVLDSGMEIYVWFPPYSGRLERIAGINVGRNIRDHERAGRGNVHILDIDWNNNDSFFRKIGGRKDHPMKDAAAGGRDEGHLRRFKPKVKLFKVSDAGGKIQVTHVAEGDLSYDMLNSKDAFILDTHIGNVFVWVGKLCTTEERQKAMQYAEKYLEEHNRPNHTQVVRILDTGEPRVFMQWFAKQPAHAPAVETALYHCTDESGELEVDEIVDFEQDDLDTDDVMILDTGEKIYVWVGIDANEKEKQHAQATAEKYLETDAVPRSHRAKIITIQQGSEPVEFRVHFPEWDLTKFGKRSVDEAKHESFWLKATRK